MENKNENSKSLKTPISEKVLDFIYKIKFWFSRNRRKNKINKKDPFIYK